MLILTRRTGETICIGDDVKITISQQHGGQVKLAIEAPHHIEIHRKEIWDRIQFEKKRIAGQ